ncbi:MAG: CHAT domain-containing protein [Candidatus Obscuribacterales bacterium]|nr:CHAT domain-containing protein [Candidatus Obscuribacterales bacterium]
MAIDKNLRGKSDSGSSEEELLAQIVKLIQGCRYAEAIPYSQELVDICVKQYGPEHAITATVLHNLGFLYQQLGEYSQAEPILRKALTIREKSLGPDAADLALSLNSLALLYQDEGDYPRAEDLYKRALKIKKKIYGAESPEQAFEMNNLAALYKEKGDLEQSEKLFNSVLPIFEKSFGVKDLRVATVLNNLAGVYREKGDFARAEALYERVNAIDSELLPPAHPDRARDLNNLAVLNFDEGKRGKAETLYMEALSIREAALGRNHPELVPLLDNLAVLCLSNDELARAIAFQKRGNEISEQSLAMILSSGSENEKRLFLDRVSNEIDSTLSMHIKFAADNKDAGQLAMGTILRRKGRVLDAVSKELTTLRRHLSEDDRKLLDQLSSTRADLAALILRGPASEASKQYGDNVAALQEQAQKLENEVSLHSAAFRSRQKQVTVEQVQREIPANAALVEFQTYRVLDAKAANRSERFGERHYAAYVLSRKGPPAVVDLGDCSSIDRSVAEFRTAIRKIRSDEFKQKSRELDKLLMQPLRSLLKDTQTLLLSPDGTLNLVPFSALMDAEGKYLIENYSIDYLTSGRDLLRMGEGDPSRQGTFIIADPLFGEPVADANSAGEEGGRGIPFSAFKALPGTAREARSISAILQGAQVVTGRDADKAIFKKLAGPKILHIATHGYFLPDALLEQISSGNETNRSINIIGRAHGSAFTANPLLRSGLVLAGANQKNRNADKDGILTALEVSGLDLWGTKLVVLSACDTGLGEIKQGEGVYGLRRALLIAGAESELVSLWPVSDQATASFMTEFYKRLISGQSRLEALRQSQLLLLQTMKHPNFWAAFIPIGDWRKL